MVFIDDRNTNHNNYQSSTSHRMKVKREIYCSVCLRTSENGYEVIDQGTCVILQVLSIELDWDSSEECFLCQECEDMAKKSFDFKLVSSDSVNRYWVKRNRLKLEHSPGNSKSTETDIVEEFTKCLLCRSRVESDKVLSIDILLNDPNIIELYPRCMADIDLADLKGAVVCITCKEIFEGYFNFVRNYLNAKENVKMNFKKEIFNGNSKQEKLELFGAIIESSMSTEIGEVKQKLDQFEGYVGLEAQYESLEYQEVNIKDETVIVKIEDEDRKKNVFDPFICNLQVQRHKRKHVLKEIIIETNVCTYETDKQIFRCANCTYESTRKEELKKHSLTHKNSSERNTIKNDSCTYNPQHKNVRTKRKFPKTTVPDSQMYKCDICTYETKNKKYLAQHISTHKSKSEGKIYKCKICLFETRHSNSLITHNLTHKSMSEVPTFKCASCPFECKRKEYLKAHLLTHKSKSEVETFKCAICAFESKRKQKLVRHIMTHRKKSELQTFKCANCPFESKRKDGLAKHILTHKRKLEVKTLKCTSCPFETKRKISLSSHKRNSDKKMYKCESCTFKIKSQINSKRRKAQTFKCESCTYETKHKKYLKGHMICHKSLSEVKTFKCDSCTFETKRKNALVSHFLTHKSNSEVKIYKCGSCTFETKYKHGLKRHNLTHERNSENKM